MEPVYRQARADDAVEIAELVNRAYRPDEHERGWTHEADLVHGQRISADQVQKLIAPDSTILVMQTDGRIVACVHVQVMGQACYIGMLATRPDLQVSGLGKQMLAHAESFARTRYGVDAFRMSVLSSRPELLAFYERRGYTRTGESEPYPLDAGVGTPLDPSVRVLLLNKIAQ